jgi:uncharacterized protein DUF3159
VVPATTGAAGERDESGLSAPTFLGVVRTGLPGFLREGFLPLGAFYAGLKVSGLAAGIVAALAASLVVYLLERRAGRDALLVRLSLGLVAVQSIVGLLANSATVYLAQPVLVNAAWGVACIVSAAIGRPLVGALASAWYPFPRWFRETDLFKRVYGVESVVWGLYFLARSALRLAALLQGGVDDFLLVVLLTGPAAMAALTAWSIWYAIRKLAREN